MAERGYRALGFSPVRAVTADAHREPRTRATGRSGAGYLPGQGAGGQVGRRMRMYETLKSLCTDR